MTATFTLDEAQSRVAHSEASARLVVEAGPGTGKTETVSARIEYLMEEEGIGPASILVISFSRAAVEAVQRRQRSRGTHMAVWATTLDAFAARLLVESGMDPSSLSFDHRIDKIRKQIEAGDASESLPDIAHIIIDESQDIVGRRAAFVASLLSSLSKDVGFTILGDPFQALYDFQLGPGELGTPTVAETGIALGATALQLTGQYRAATRDAGRAMSMRPLTSAPSAWRANMLEWMTTSPRIRDDEDLVRTVSKDIGSVAILTDTNAAALAVFQMLTEAGVAAELLPRAADRALAPWVAELLGDLTGSLTRDDFLRVASNGLPIDAGEAWALMRRLTPARTRFLDVRELTRRLSVGLAPIALGSPRHKVVVSTVHRAKGLEFDNVYLLHPNDWNSEDELGLTRQMFVAITRPRRTLFTFTRNASMKRWYIDKRSDRVIRPKNRGTTGFEIRGVDWRGPTPPNRHDDPVRTQDVLRRVGLDGPRPVQVELNPDRSTRSAPVYEASLDGTSIGALNTEFVDVFSRRIGRDRWPQLLNLHLVGVETVTGIPQQGTVGRNGLWLSPQIVGLASLDWSKA